MDLRFTPSEQRFAAELTAFIEANLPPGRQFGDRATPRLDWEFEREFLRLMGCEGWLVPAWPVEYGGRGAGYIEQLIFYEVTGYYRVPMTMAIDTVQFHGPTILAYGTEEQKRRWLPPMARGEEWWAQGFSEPNAGSDLASLQMPAVLESDTFVLNGSKIWSETAQHASWYLVLCRTDPEAPRHRGISMIAVETDAKGLRFAPIVDMAGHDYFNQSFFEDVRVPRDNLVGELNRGWYAAMTTFDFERSGVAHIGHIRRFFDELLAHTRETGLIADPRVAAALAGMRVEIEVAKWLCYRVAGIFASGAHPNHESPMAKLFITEVLQRVYQEALGILGLASLVRPESAKWAMLLGRPAIAALWGVGQTIGGGTSEIQRTIIATRGLGLPRG